MAWARQTHLRALSLEVVAPASTASKAPAKPESSKAAKKTASKSKAAAPADGEKKKRKKTRKETYSSYIYKGAWHMATLHSHLLINGFPLCDRFIPRKFPSLPLCHISAQAGPPGHGYLQQGDGHPELLRQRHLRAYRH